MLATRGYAILNPTWNLVSDMYTQKFGAWQQAKEMYVLKNGSWQKIWNRNIPGPVGQEHPFWRYGFNYNFQKTDDTLSWGTFFSTNNAGFYFYPNVGVLRLHIGAVDGNGYGDCWLDPGQPLRVNPGEIYTHSVYVEGKTAGVNMSIRAYSNVTEDTAAKGGNGRTAFESNLQDVPAGNTVSLSITIPSGHFWIKPYLFIQTNNALPRYYRFSNWRFRRTG